MRTIAVDYQDSRGPHDATYRLCVGGGHAKLGLLANAQEHLAAARRDCGFEYLRCHGVLHDNMGVYAEDDQGKPIYGWQYVDALFDFYREIGLKPFVELSSTPKALASGERTLFNWRANVTPPKSPEKWGALVEEFVRHWEKRYGRDEVASWYFEVWNEPNVKEFWTGTREDYFTLYRYAAEAVKRVGGDYRVGGPATASFAWITELIDFCEANDVPLDFVSSHNYGILGDFDATGKVTFRLDNHPRVFWGPMEEMHETIRNSARPDLEFHITEWSTSYSSRDPVHDSYLSPAFLVDKVKKTEGHRASMAYWGYSDVFEELGPPQTPFHGGFGLMTFQGLKKPAYILHQWLNRLGPTELTITDQNAWACRSDRGVQVLLWDYTYQQQDAGNQEFFIRDLPAKDIAPATISLTNLPPGPYQLAVHRVGYRSNDVYADYMDLGSPDSLTPDEVRWLAARNDGGPEHVRRVTVGEHGTFTTELKMRENDVILVTLTEAP